MKFNLEFVRRKLLYYIINLFFILIFKDIADVTQFLRQNSLLDVEARNRATTIYLSDRRFNMLPKLLSEDLCSLREHRDRYAVSVIFTMKKIGDEYEEIDVWFGRTVIRSCSEMHYEAAQQLLDNPKIIQVKKK